jgi:hypothetical protein
MDRMDNMHHVERGASMIQDFLGSLTSLPFSRQSLHMMGMGAKMISGRRMEQILRTALELRNSNTASCKNLFLQSFGFPSFHQYF